VPKLDLEAPSGSGPTEELAVTVAVKSLEAAANRPGAPLVAVLAGRYQGFKVGDVP